VNGRGQIVYKERRKKDLTVVRGNILYNAGKKSKTGIFGPWARGGKQLEKSPGGGKKKVTLPKPRKQIPIVPKK